MIEVFDIERLCIRIRSTFVARLGRALLMCGLVASAILAPNGQVEAGEARPTRIVSINMCTDELLLRLADRRNIASVTWLSRDEINSNVAALAQAVPANHGLAEEVLAFRPDLVIAGAFTTRSTVQILRRTGVKVVEFGVPRTMDEVRAEIRDVAATIGERERGEAIVREMDARLAALTPRSGAPRRRAIVLRPNGFTVAKGSLVGEIMHLAGLDNMAAHIGIPTYLQIPLEAVVLQRADVLIMNGEANGPPSLATEALRHPVIKTLGERLKVVPMPSRLWTCAGPAVVDAVQWLVAQTSGDGRKAAP